MNHKQKGESKCAKDKDAVDIDKKREKDDYHRDLVGVDNDVAATTAENVNGRNAVINRSSSIQQPKEQKKSKCIDGVTTYRQRQLTSEEILQKQRWRNQSKLLRRRTRAKHKMHSGTKDQTSSRFEKDNRTLLKSQNHSMHSNLINALGTTISTHNDPNEGQQFEAHTQNQVEVQVTPTIAVSSEQQTNAVSASSPVPSSTAVSRAAVNVPVGVAVAPNFLAGTATLNSNNQQTLNPQPSADQLLSRLVQIAAENAQVQQQRQFQSQLQSEGTPIRPISNTQVIEPQQPQQTHTDSSRSTGSHQLLPQPQQIHADSSRVVVGGGAQQLLSQVLSPASSTLSAVVIPGTGFPQTVQPQLTNQLNLNHQLQQLLSASGQLHTLAPAQPAPAGISIPLNQIAVLLHGTQQGGNINIVHSMAPTQHANPVFVAASSPTALIHQPQQSQQRIQQATIQQAPSTSNTTPNTDINNLASLTDQLNTMLQSLHNLQNHNQGAQPQAQAATLPSGTAGNAGVIPNLDALLSTLKNASEQLGTTMSTGRNNNNNNRPSGPTTNAISSSSTLNSLPTSNLHNNNSPSTPGAGSMGNIAVGTHAQSATNQNHLSWLPVFPQSQFNPNSVIPATALSNQLQQFQSGLSLSRDTSHEQQHQ